MKRPSVFACLLYVLTTLFAQAPAAEPAQALRLGNAEVRFATVAEAQKVLGARDEFVRRMGSFERAVRLKTDREVSEAEYLRFVEQNILPWSDAERERIASRVRDLDARCKTFPLPFPKRILLIKTTGEEESNAAYTRADAIILPQNGIVSHAEELQETICHEAFHVLSRANPELRDRLYATIGFVPCDEVELPAELKSRKLTNPDAPTNRHAVRVRFRDRDAWAVPVLFIDIPKSNLRIADNFLLYIQLRFLVAECSPREPKSKPIFAGKTTHTAVVKQLAGFHEQVGFNTSYIVHPEEILADQFAMLILRKPRVASPEILEKMRQVLLKP